jgi:hypothetical protein
MIEKRRITTMGSLFTAATLLSSFANEGPPTDTFWKPDPAGDGIVHTVGTTAPVELCMQGRKVVMQTQVDATAGLSYQARFFHVDPDLTKKGKVMATVGNGSNPMVRVNGKPLRCDIPVTVSFDGMLTLVYPQSEGIVTTRTVYPSLRSAVVVDEWHLRNATDKAATVEFEASVKEMPGSENTVLLWAGQWPASTVLEPGATVSLAGCLQARLKAAPDTNTAVDVKAEHAARHALTEAAWRGPGRLETPDPLLDQAFALQKLHVLECPIETIKGVIVHNGSLTYSPGIWANDPVEYSSPLFPFFGDSELNRASMGMYRVWLDHCRQNGIVPFPGSFESPALKLTQRERGDDAMVLYGLAKFLLFQGDPKSAEEMWPLIEFAAASVLSQTTADGIVASKTDEMEGRYPTGNANLSTSSLAYGGYRLAAGLARSLGKPVGADFDRRADALRKGIEAYFGAEVEGFKTYRYYKDNVILRGWILLPLAMGIPDRQEATVAALTSDKLWPHRLTGGDILASSNRPTEWGRETYYALRVLFKAGRTDEALDLTRRVVKAQILGAKGPYPDEDAIDMLCPGSLYPRVFTEGMFGIVPTGLDSFECTPWLPAGWPRMALRDMRAFGRAWDLVVEREGEQQKITVASGGKVVMTAVSPVRKTHSVRFPPEK